MITGKAKVTGLLGWPVSHSLSPQIHNEWLARYNIDGVYIPMPVHPDHLRHVIAALGTMAMRGCNLTVPHKEVAIDCIDEVDSIARRIGAINTIRWDEQGRSMGFNTDAYGFIASLRQQHGDVSTYIERPMVIGAGGAARAVIAALQDAGAESISLMNRTADKADQLAQTMGENISVCGWSQKPAALAEATLLVNTTSLGMRHQPPLEISLDSLPPTALVCDIVYAPLMTPLITSAAEKGNPIATGIGMLAHQAAKAFEIWHGLLPDIEDSWLHTLSQSVNGAA